MIKKDERNVALGKAHQLMNTLKYLIYESPQLCRAARNLFIKRMGCLLPSRFKNEKLWHMIHLPKQMGGLGLGFPDEMIYHLKRSPYPIQALVSKAQMGLDVREEGRILRKLTENPSVRGIPALTDLFTKLQSSIEDPAMSEFSWNEVGLMAPPSSTTFMSFLEKIQREHDFQRPNEYIRALRIGERENIMTHHKWIRKFLRPEIFSTLLTTGSNRTNMFNTITIKDRYVKVRDYILELAGSYEYPDYSNLTGSGLKALCYKMDEIRMIDGSEEIFTMSEWGVTFTTLDELSTQNAPNLAVRIEGLSTLR
jgi:hypothetical protein